MRVAKRRERERKGGKEGERKGRKKTERERQGQGEKGAEGRGGPGRGAWQETTDGNISEWRRVGEPV